MNNNHTKRKIIILTIFGIVIVAFAILTWAYQAGKIGISASTNVAVVSKNDISCKSVGTKSEGWYSSNITSGAYQNISNLIQWDKCSTCGLKCVGAGSIVVTNSEQYQANVDSTTCKSAHLGQEIAKMSSGNCNNFSPTSSPTPTATVGCGTHAAGEKWCSNNNAYSCAGNNIVAMQNCQCATGTTPGCSNGTCTCTSATATATPTATATSTPTSTVTTLRPPTDVKAELQTDNTSVKITGKYGHALTNSYKIYNADNNQLIKQVNATTIEGTGAILTGLKCATTYRYYLIASGDIYDQANDKFIVSSGITDSSASDIVSVTTPTCGTTDTGISDKTPTGQTASAGQSTIKISWDAIVGATGYDIYSCNDQLITSTSDTSYAFTGLPCNTDYCYYVKAHDASGKESKASSQVKTTTSACSATGQTTSTSSTATVAQLVSTGSSLWLNILIAIILTAAIGYFIFRDELFSRK